jgi:hypothetical protein
MNIKTKLLLGSVLIIAIWEIAPRVLNLRRPSQTVQQAAKSDKDQAFAVVQNYVDAANRGDSKKLLALTSPIPKGARVNSLEPPATDEKRPSQPGVAVATSTDVVDQGSLHEIRSRFPETLANGREKISSIQKFNSKDGFAKVWVTFETEYLILNTPWIFMLARNPDGQWRIYDINSQYNAVQYLPVETKEP